MKNGSEKIHYKMYKVGRKWAFAAITTASFAMATGISVNGHASDDVQAGANTEMIDNSAAESQSASLGLNQLVTSETIQPVDEGNTAATPEISTTTDVEIPAESSSMNDDAIPTANPIEITKENFEDYFELTGTPAAQYDKSTGIVTLTEEENNQVGNFYLRAGIDTTEYFRIQGAINLGRLKPTAGADGIGIAFFPVQIPKTGTDGANLGIGGLFNATGFGFDTYQNGFAAPNASGNSTSDRFGWPKDVGTVPYGDWFKTTDADAGYVDSSGWNWSETRTSTSNRQVGGGWVIKDPSGATVQDLGTVDQIFDNKFHGLDIIYIASPGDPTKSGTLYIYYNPTGDDITEDHVGMLTWSSDIAKDETTLDFSVSASTGGAKNLQQFKLKEFTYVESREGSILVHWQDEDGNTLLPSTSIIEAIDGTEYSTNEFGEVIVGDISHSVADESAFDGYTFSHLDGRYLLINDDTEESGLAEGTGRLRADTAIELTYVFVRQTGTVTTNFVDEAGNTLADSVQTENKVGEDYTTSPIDIEDYDYSHVLDGSAPVSGTYINGNLDVTYVYVRQTGTVTTHFVDEAGNTLADSVQTENKVGEVYSTSPIDIEDYDYSHVLDGSAPVSGTYINGNLDVTYVYVRQTGTVTTHFVDEAGNTLADSVQTENKVGEIYDTAPIEIEGYTYSHIQTGSANPTGFYINGNLDVTYVYTKNVEKAGTVVTHFVDEDGNQIADSFVISGAVGENYSSNPISIPGYTFSHILTDSDPTSGQFVDGELTITFVYTKNVDPIDPEIPVDPEVPVDPERPSEPELPSSPDVSNQTTSDPQALPESLSMRVIPSDNNTNNYNSGKTETLPQTDEKTQSATMFGYLILGLSTFVSLITFGKLSLKKQRK